MKARKLELKEIEMTDEVWNSTSKTFETVKQGTFSYREIIRTILVQPSNAQGGNSCDEVIKSVLLYGKLKDAMKTSSNVVLLDKEDYDYLLPRLNAFKWAIAHPCVAEFIKYIRELPEVEVEEKKAEATPASPPSATPAK